MNHTEEHQRSILGQVIWMFLGVIGGIGVVYYLLPIVLPGLTASLAGEEIKAYWYLSRGSAIIAYLLLWLSMMFGLLLTTKIGKLWPGLARAMDMHQFVSLLGLFFVAFHALVLMGDAYLKPGFWQLLIPFSGFSYRPEWVIWGQFGLILWVVLVITSYFRKRIGRKTWRVLHFGSFLMFVFALIHGIGSGSDTGAPAMQALYWVSAGSVLFLLIFRMIAAFLPETKNANDQPQMAAKQTNLT